MDTKVQKFTCPNCQSEHEGSYCNFCGQKQYSHKETFGELVFKFFSDFTHFDSRFFRSVIPLIFKPGRLTIDYNEGRRARQFHPIRLYIFSSFIYFLLVFGCNSMEHAGGLEAGIARYDSDSIGSELLKDSSPLKVSGNTNRITIASDADSTVQLSITGLKGFEDMIKRGVTPYEYTAWQDSLPSSQRDGFVRRYAIRQSLKLYYEGRKDGEGLVQKIGSSILHNIPKMLFFLLPVFAALLKLLYIRKKQYYYVDHAVFSLHYFSFVFILLTLSGFILDPVFNSNMFTNIAIIWIFLYLYLAMKRIYKNRFFSTLVRYCLLIFVFFLFVSFAFIINLVVSAAMA